MGVYLPLLNKLDLHLFEICENADKLSKTLVRSWLKSYMFKGDVRAGDKATKITKYLSTHRDRLSHGKPITIDVLKNQLKLPVLDLRETPDLRDMFSQLWAEIEWFVDNTDTAKFFENSYGVAFRRRFQIQQLVNLQLAPMPPQQPAQPGPPNLQPG